jgi:hypothetical protein
VVVVVLLRVAVVQVVVFVRVHLQALLLAPILLKLVVVVRLERDLLPLGQQEEQTDKIQVLTQ